MKKSLFEKVEAEVIDAGKEYVETKIKRKAIRIGEISVLVILAFILISIGLSQLIANTYPTLTGGYSYILLGFIYLLVGFLLNI